MKRAIHSILLLVGFAAMFGAGCWYTRLGAVTKTAVPGTRTVHRYACPMHPDYTSDRRGDCPACGMALVAVNVDNRGIAPAASRARLATRVKVSVDTQQLIGVRVEPVAKTGGTRTLRIFGRVVPDEARVYTLNAGVDGYIRELSGVTTGSRVEKDQWLASFFALEARAPIQAYLTSLDVLDRAEKAGLPPEQVMSGDATAQLGVERLKGVGMSAAQIEEIKRTRQVPLMIRIVAPAGGLVLSRNVSPGQKFEKGNEWYRIADLTRVWILADVFDADEEDIHPGASARVSVPGRPASLRARVSDVLPQVDPATRSVKVRLEADNPGYALRPGMFVDVEIAVRVPATVAVPVDAVVDSGNSQTVFVNTGEGVFEPRRVETGWRRDNRVQIVQGLMEGERVVTSGTFLLDSESRLRLATPGFAAAKTPTRAERSGEAGGAGHAGHSGGTP
jgi:Cu(I)/Ag(I) efflux system membrane fusion protein